MFELSPTFGAPGLGYDHIPDRVPSLICWSSSHLALRRIRIRSPLARQRKKPSSAVHRYRWWSAEMSASRRALANRLVVRPATGVEQRQGTQWRSPAAVVRLVGPGSLLRILQLLEKLHPAFNRLANFFGRDRQLSAPRADRASVADATIVTTSARIQSAPRMNIS